MALSKAGRKCSSEIWSNGATPNGVVQSPTDYDSFNFINIHYYAVGATLFGTDVQGGYEYEEDVAGDPLVYRGQNTFVGLHNPTPDGQSLVDCIGCHLNSAVDEADQKRHTFLPKVEDCNQCHSGQAFQDLSGSPGDNFREINLLKADLLAAMQDYAQNGLPQPSPMAISAARSSGNPNTPQLIAGKAIERAPASTARRRDSR